MNNENDDFPHPIPPIAYIRWKENYFFLIMDPVARCFGMIHLNNEPSFNRLRVSAHFSLDGEVYLYANEAPLPEPFAMSPTIGDGRITLTIHQSHKLFGLKIDTDQLKGEFEIKGRLPSFDFAQCKYSAPDLVPFKEVMTIGTNLPFNHIQQSTAVKGRITVLASGQEFAVDRWGYRDHSWGMRSDNVVSEHTWCGLNFQDRAFGVMTIRSLIRPTIEAKEGYVVDSDGLRPLRKIGIVRVGGGADGLPDKLVHHLEDVFGRVFTIESDVAGRHAQVPLAAEKPDGDTVYEVTENFTKSVLRETGEEGFSLIELGRSSVKGGIG